MNENTPPAFVGPTPVRIPPVDKPDPGPPVRLSRLLLGLALAVAIFDLCFWDIRAWGLSTAVFFLALAGIILGNRQSWSRERSTKLLLVLLVGALVATVIEASLTNTLVLFILIIVLAGNTFFREVVSPWGRWLSQGVALIRAPGRIFWLGAMLLEAAFSEGLGWTGGLLGGCLLTIPALVLALVFGSLLATGNVVFGNWTSSFFTWFWKELALYFDPARMALWCFIAFLVLPLLRPANVAAWWWAWTERLPRLPEVIPSRAAFFSSAFTLVVLNLIFLVANLADALYLWSGQTLPSGVEYKAYVHEGVNALITTVILTAIVLTVIFQQELNVARRRELKVLALVWVVQNLFLLMSVALRLKYYIEAFQMSVARLSVIIFLVLVAVGFALLTAKIVKEKSLSWLVGGCLLAVFATFYVTQFLNLAGWSADYNEAHWEKDRTHTLDLGHMYEYGAAAWPAMRKVHDLDPSIPMFNEDSRVGMQNGYTIHQAQFDPEHWRGFSLRAYWNRWAINDKK